MNKNRTFTDPDDKLVLEISADKLTAFLTINDNGIISEKEILDLITAAGIKKGFDLAAGKRQQNNQEAVFAKPFLLAQGDFPEQIEITSKIDNHAVPGDSGEIEINKLAELITIPSDTVLAGVSFPKFESDVEYHDIFGDITGFDTIKKHLVSLYLGEGVDFDPASNGIISRNSGYPWRDETGRFHICSNLIYRGDIDNSKIFIWSDLTVIGDIENSSLEVSGNLKIQGEIRNCLKNWITATGNIELLKAENSRIASGKSIKVHSTARNCHLLAALDISGSREAVISGGLTQCGRSVNIGCLGGNQNEYTEVEITIKPFLKRKWHIQAESISESKKTQKRKEVIPDHKETEILENELLNSYEKFPVTSSTQYFIKADQKIMKGTNLYIFNQKHVIIQDQSSFKFNWQSNESERNGG
ncbi:MAG: DUF342 domain-containing protein [Candidatus Cloacimonetes bacterium]|nr:DUF342 domain-containing protein [Candidatus Cloacimonadota bacterium]